MRNQKVHVAALAAVSMMSLIASASQIVVQDDINDYEAQKRSDSTGGYIASENNLQARVGHQTNFNNTGANAPGGIETILFFKLPVLNPGDTLNSATYSQGLVPDSATSAVTPTFNGDAYVLGVTAGAPAKTAAEAQNFFYIGNTAQTSLASPLGGSVSRFADNFLVPGDFIPNGSPESASPKTGDLTSYIQNLYANPGANSFTPGTSFLVVRINPDASPPPTSGTQRYSLAWQGTVANGGIGSAANKPQITLDITPAPEPASVAVLALGGLTMLRRRRKA
jgi:hypothetical protein